MLNANKNDYITDLLNENKRLFASNEAIKLRLKQLKGKRNEIESSAHTLKQWAYCLELTSRIIGLYTALSDNMRDIKENLNKVEGLKNETIKTI